MPKFRKKPVVIEAMRVPPISSITDRTILYAWLLRHKGVRDLSYGSDNIEIHTLEGVMVANIGDWIICGIAGELYPCKDPIFKETYEPVEDDAEVTNA